MTNQLLQNDLDKLLTDFPDNPNLTDWQKENYLSKKEGEGLRREQLGISPDGDGTGLKLPKHDGYDDGPVGSVTAEEALRYWNMDNDHAFMPLNDLVRVGFFFHLTIVETLFLCIKAQWERYLAEIRNYPEAGSFREIMAKDPTDGEITGFRPEINTVYIRMDEFLELVQCRMEDRPEAVREAVRLRNLMYLDVEKEAFTLLAEEMILNRLFLRALDSPELALFISQKSEEHQRLLETEEKLRREFWDCKCVWLSLNEKNRTLLFEAETARLAHARDLGEFLNLFPEYIDLTAINSAVAYLKRRLMLLKENPAMTREELDAVFEKEEKRLKEEQEEMKDRAGEGDSRRRIAAKGTIDPRELKKYREWIKDLLQEISLKTHPDALLSNPAYSRLSGRQKEDLRDLWEESRKVKSEELKFGEDTLGWHQRSVEQLMEIVDQVDKILEHAGIDVDAGNIISGDTITEQLAWLNERNALLHKCNSDLRQEIRTLSSGKDIREKRAMRDSSEDIRNELRKKMQEQIDRLRLESAGLSQKIEQAFTGEDKC